MSIFSVLLRSYNNGLLTQNVDQTYTTKITTLEHKKYKRK